MWHDSRISSNDARRQLADQQAQLVRALKTGQIDSELFASPGLSLAAQSLLNKRFRSIEKMWPEIAAVMKEQWRGCLRQYADQFPFADDGPDDGRRFMRWLVRQPQISDEARVVALAALVRRGWPIRVVMLRASRSMMLAWRDMRGKVRSLRLGLPWKT